jgi:hypothetical protein
MSWGNVSLDARLAAAVCRPYRIQHEVIGFDESFAAEVGERALTASRLSGGLAAVGEAIEVAFYERIGGPWRSRISGFLGNQIGRGGHEQVSLRRGHTDVLADTIRQNASDDEGGAPSMSLWAETCSRPSATTGSGITSRTRRARTRVGACSSRSPAAPRMIVARPAPRPDVT